MPHNVSRKSLILHKYLKLRAMSTIWQHQGKVAINRFVLTSHHLNIEKVCMPLQPQTWWLG